jgi:hypothetical protein
MAAARGVVFQEFVTGAPLLTRATTVDDERSDCGSELAVCFSVDEDGSTHAMLRRFEDSLESPTDPGAVVLFVRCQASHHDMETPFDYTLFDSGTADYTDIMRSPEWCAHSGGGRLDGSSG